MSIKKLCLMLPALVTTMIVLFLLSTSIALAGSIFQQASGGFGDPHNVAVWSMAVYGGRIYAGTNEGTHGCEIWSSNGSGWTQVIGGGPAGSSTAPGFGSANNYIAGSMAVFGDFLYVGTGNGTGCRIWRHDGSTWTQVVGAGPGGTATGPGFGNAGNESADSIVVYGSHIYVGTWNDAGCQVWRSTNGTDWAPVVGGTAPMPAGFGSGENKSAECMCAYGANLYAGTYNLAVGCQLWRYDGTNWTAVVGGGAAMPAGFGSVNDFTARGMAVFESSLYVGTPGGGGCEVRRFDGTNWTLIVGPGGPMPAGFGSANNTYAFSMTAYDSHLYVGTYNTVAGCEVWLYSGTGWSQIVGQDPAGTWGTGHGFGNSHNAAILQMGVFDSRIFFATQNMNQGCEIWSTKSATTWYLAEGATTGGYETWILVQNPNASSVGITIKFQTGAGEVVGPVDTIPANSRRSYLANTYVSSFDVSTKVTSNGPDIICERSVYWTPSNQTTRVLGHDSIGVIAPAMKWYLAEGVTKGGYETWVLVQNPNPAPVGVDIKFQTQEGQVQGPTDTIAAKSRKSYLVDSWVDTFNVSSTVTSTTPGGLVICERAVYYTPDGSTHKEVGTDSIGIVEPASTWYLAEGASDGGYESFILVQNPNPVDVNVNVKYQTTNGEVQGPQEAVFARSRKTFRINDKVRDFNVSTTVSSFGGDVICERSMYWTPPGSTQKNLGHDSIGVRMGDLSWYLAEGATKGGFETWILVQNPNAAPVTVDLKFQTGTGQFPTPGNPPIRDTIPGQSRRSYKVNNWVTDYDVSTQISSLGGLIICERAVYWTPAGRNIKVLGTDSIGFTLY